MNFIEELKWRGMLHDVMPETETILKSQNLVAGYIGFDPTADSLHIGSLSQIMTLIHFQNAGHKPIILLGGATGMIGDPSGKSEERNLLDVPTLNKNLNGIKKQLAQFLNFDAGNHAAEIVNNYDWFQNFNFLDFIRDIGKHITVNYMMAKDSVKKRLSGEEKEGMSFTEFSYQLIQAYDFYYLWKHKNVLLQMGGSDQWGNITTGTELIRRKEGGKAYALTTQLITNSDGGKFGKSEQGNIWLDAEKTSPYLFYQFWLNVSDEDAKRYIKIFTLFSKVEVEMLYAEHEAAPHLRILQKQLAQDITTRVHGTSMCKSAIAASEILFGKGTEESLKLLDENDFLSIFKDVPQFEIKKNQFEQGIDIIDLLTSQTSIFFSKSEARKMIDGGGVSINKIKLQDTSYQVNTQNLMNKKYLLLQKGKKNYYLIHAI